MEFQKVELKVNGQTLVVDPNKLHPTWLQKVVEYGCRRFPNDSFSGEKGQTKFDLVAGLLNDMQSGEPMPERTPRRSAAPKDPIAALAFKTAKTLLLDIFKTRTERSKIADIVDFGDEAINAYFRDTDNGPVWNEESIYAFIEKQKEAGKRDFMKEAEAALAIDI